MINKKIEDALNKQINEELFSAYIYFSMSAYFTSLNLMGFANWMNVQAQEEMTHVIKFCHYLQDRGGRVELFAIEKPQKSWKSPIDAFNEALKHEQHITKLINGLVDLSIKEKDHASNQFLQWFVTEQVEEEASADEIIQKLKLVGNQGEAIYMLDKEMAQRVFTPPPAK